MVSAFITLIIFAVVNLIMMLLNNQKGKCELKKAIRLPFFYLLLGCISLVFWIGVLVLMSVFQNGTAFWWVYLIFCIFVLISLSLVLAYLNWRVVLNKNDFIYRTFWRKTYQVAYTDVLDAKFTHNLITLRTKEKSFFIDPHAVGIHKLTQRYLYIHKNKYLNGKAIRLPKIQLWIGFIGSIFFVGLMVYINVFPDSTDSAAKWWVYIGSGLYVLLGLYLILAYQNWFVIMFPYDFVFRSVWRKKYRVAYSDICCVKVCRNVIKLRTKHKSFSIDPHVVGIEYLMQRINK